MSAKGRERGGAGTGVQTCLCFVRVTNSNHMPAYQLYLFHTSVEPTANSILLTPTCCLPALFPINCSAYFFYFQFLSGSFPFLAKNLGSLPDICEFCPTFYCFGIKYSVLHVYLARNNLIIKQKLLEKNSGFMKIS